MCCYAVASSSDLLVVEAVSSYAQFQIEDLEFNRFLADLIASRSWRNLRDYQLANLAFAAATLELGPEANLYSCLEAALYIYRSRRREYSIPLSIVKIS